MVPGGLKRVAKAAGEPHAADGLVVEQVLGRGMQRNACTCSRCSINATGPAQQPFKLSNAPLTCFNPRPLPTAGLQQLSADSLELLRAALYDARFPALFDLRVWGSIIGMFELNNLNLFVPSPAQRWANLLEELPEGEREAAQEEAGGCGSRVVEASAYAALLRCSAWAPRAFSELLLLLLLPLRAHR